MTIIYIALASVVVGLIAALALAIKIMSEDEGDQQVQFIGKAIREGAMAFLSREYRLLTIFVVGITVILALLIDYDITRKVTDSGNSINSSELLPRTALAYLIGAIGSGLAGFIGMSIAIRANTRTAVKAQH